MKSIVLPIHADGMNIKGNKGLGLNLKADLCMSIKSLPIKNNYHKLKSDAMYLLFKIVV